MKSVIAAAAAVLLSCSALDGMPPAGITLDVHEVASGTLSADSWSTSWGSYDRTTLGDKTLEVTVRNVSRLKGKVNVTVYFLAGNVRVGNAAHDFDLRGEIEVKSRVVAPTTLMRTLNLAAIGYQHSEGKAPPAMWAAIARNGSSEGPIIAVRASSESMRLQIERWISSGELK